MLRFLLRAKQKGKVHEMHNSSARVMEHNSQNMTLIGLGRLKDDNNRNWIHIFGEIDQLCV